MGQFTDGKPLPNMPPGVQPLHAGDNDGDENAVIQSQSWGDRQYDKSLPINTFTEADESGEAAEYEDS